MKIAVVTEIINTHSGSRAPVDLALSLGNAGHEVTILALSKKCNFEVKKNLEENGVLVILLAGNKLIASTKLLLKLKRIRPKIVSLHATLPFTIASKLSGFPIVKTFYGTQLDAYYERIFPREPNISDKFVNFLANKIIILKEKAQFLIGNKVVAISKFTKQQALKLYGEKIDYCYLAVGNFPKAENFFKGKNFILSVSRFTPYKRFHQLIGACGNLPLVIVGSGENRRYLNYLKRIKGKNCKILVDISDSKLSDLYRKCLFYASFDKLPFFGLPIIEAGFHSKPSVAANFGAISELIQNGKTGFVVNNSAEFSKKAQLLFNNLVLTKKLGTKAKERTRKLFNLRNLSNEYSKIFNEILTKKNPDRHHLLFLTLIILAGAILRLIYLAHHNFWFDEAFSYFVAKQRLKDIILATAADSHPPFYYFLLHFWQKLGSSEIFLRLLSVIFGVLQIPAIYFLGKNLFNKRVGLVTALISALSPLLIYYSTESRMYILTVFFTTLTFLFFFNLLKRWSAINGLLFTITLTLSFYTNYYSLLLLIPLNLIIFTYQKRNLINILFFQTASLALFLPWILIFLQNSHPAILATKSWIALPVTFVSFILGGTGIVTLREFFQATDRLVTILFILSLVLFGIIFVEGLENFKKNLNFRLVLAILLSPIIFIFLVNLVKPVYSVRATIIFAPFFYLLLASKITQLRDGSLKFTIGLVCALFTIINFIQISQPKFGGPPLKLASKITQNNIPIVHSSILTYYPFRFYSDDNLNYLMGFNPLTLQTEKSIETKRLNLDDLPQKFIFVEIKNGQDLQELARQKQEVYRVAKADEIKKIGDITLTYFKK